MFVDGRFEKLEQSNRASRQRRLNLNAAGSIIADATTREQWSSQPAFLELEFAFKFLTRFL
jgi:hypothetical protein